MEEEEAETYGLTGNNLELCPCSGFQDESHYSHRKLFDQLV